MTIKAQSDQSDSPRWWIYPLPDGTLQAAPDRPTWGGGGILVEQVRDGMSDQGNIPVPGPPAGWTPREIWLPPGANIRFNAELLEKTGQAPVMVVKLQEGEVL